MKALLLGLLLAVPAPPIDVTVITAPPEQPEPKPPVSIGVNPLGIAFRTSGNVELYAKPTGMVIAGRCNFVDPKFQAVRRGGGEVLRYLDVMERPDPGRTACAEDLRFYKGDPNRVELWPYGGGRRNWAGTKITDMRAGSSWTDHALAYIEQMMRDDQVDGVFLDVIGAQLWSSLANWNSWPKSERDEWTRGNVDFVRRLDAIRDRVDPEFIIVTNNLWHRDDGSLLGREGEKYVNGIMIEHPQLGVPAFHRAEAARTFGVPNKRRVLVIARSQSDARAWAKVKGVTHVSGQMEYATPLEPAVSFTELR